MTGSGVEADGLFPLIEKLSGVLGEEALANIFNGLPFMNQEVIDRLVVAMEAESLSATEGESEATDTTNSSKYFAIAPDLANDDASLAGSHQDFEYYGEVI